MSDRKRGSRSRRAWLIAQARRTSGTGVAVALCLGVLIADLILEPRRFNPENLGSTIGLMAPLGLAAMASAPAILAGGFDLSVGPLMSVLNVIAVVGIVGTWRLEDPWILCALTVGLGAVLGACNGFLHAVLRLPAVVATLAAYIVFGGLALVIAPAPGGEVPEWMLVLANEASIVPLIAVLLCWAAIRQTSFYDHLMAVGGDDRAAYASGVNVTAVRVGAYTLGGTFCGVAALSLTALLGSADPTVGPTYTLGAIAAVAIGGVSLAGGRGGVVGAFAGGAGIYFMQSLLTHLFTSPFALPISFGAVLVIALCVNAIVLRRLTRLGAAT